jgi:response regulator RpfG family c-di-GMP phosphodiesterase
MNDKILCVDDEENILAAYQRQLRKQFKIDTALGSVEALKKMSNSGPFAVVISDLRMPEIDGIELLAKVKQFAPDTVRMMLTGNADLHAAIEAVNQGNIFRFLTKPCHPEMLAQALQAGLEQYRLIVTEKELLEQTLKGSVGVLIEILSILDASLFGRACTLRDNVREIALSLNVSNLWDLELSAMLSEIGRVTIPTRTIMKEREGSTLTDDERKMLVRVPEIGSQLLSKIPRLESVAQTVLYQNKNFDGSGYPENEVVGKDIPLGSRIIKILNDLNQLESKGEPLDAALEVLKRRQGAYDPEMLAWISDWLKYATSRSKQVLKVARFISVDELQVGQMLLSDIVSKSGALLISAGTRVSESLRERISNFARLQEVREPIHVEITENR